ncbi:MAG: hypothetical protein ACYC9L_15885 [Sulfuricaulis sp.]
MIDYAGAQVLDLVTFDITSEEINGAGKNVLYGNQAGWPPRRITNGIGALFAGFPGNQRIQSGDREFNFGLYSAFCPVSSGSERHFGCAFDRSMWIDTMEKGLPDEGFDLGGISGCPVLAVDESPSGILSWRLAGIGYCSSTQLGEIFFAHHVDFIREDGTLNRPIEGQ